MLNEKELLRLTSLHEAAHALVGYALGGSVKQISLTLNNREQRGQVIVDFPEHAGDPEFLRKSVKVGLASEMAFEILGIFTEQRELKDTSNDLRDAECMARRIYTEDGVVDPQSAGKFTEVAKQEVRKLLLERQDVLLELAAEIAKLDPYCGRMDSDSILVIMEVVYRKKNKIDCGKDREKNN